MDGLEGPPPPKLTPPFDDPLKCCSSKSHTTKIQNPTGQTKAPLCTNQPDEPQPPTPKASSSLGRTQLTVSSNWPLSRCRLAMREYESQTDEASGDLSLYQSDAPLDQFGRNTPFAEDIAPEPSLRFSRATWWDCLLQTYDIHQYDPDPTSRQSSALEISRDVFKFFKVASYWLSFIHVPLFFDMFHHPEYRTSIQPALILAILSYSKLLQSTRENPDEAERERMWQQSVNLRDLAQASFDASYNAGWIDLQLAQAAWVSEM
ncbi:hypothetical protein FRB98_002240 [Tulasnella sp. 332]|nr:hypothetical protein FRB98_002240 [Tulasnella sp. 332]